MDRCSGRPSANCPRCSLPNPGRSRRTGDVDGIRYEHRSAGNEQNKEAIRPDSMSTAIWKPNPTDHVFSDCLRARSRMGRTYRHRSMRHTDPLRPSQQIASLHPKSTATAGMVGGPVRGSKIDCSHDCWMLPPASVNTLTDPPEEVLNPTSSQPVGVLTGETSRTSILPGRGFQKHDPSVTARCLARPRDVAGISVAPELDHRRNGKTP